MIRIARNISTNISRNVSRSIGTEPDPVLERYSGASAAYSLYDLGNRRGTVTETGETVYGDFVTYESDFSAGTDGWSAVNGTTTGNIDGIGGQDDNLRFTVGNVTDIIRARILGGITSGVSYAVAGDVYIPSTNAVVDGIKIGGSVTGDIQVSPPPDTWTPFDVNFSASTTNLNFVATDGGNSTVVGNGTDVFYIRNVTVTELDTYRTLDVAYHNPVVRLRRDSDNIHKSFPAGAFTQMLNWANEDVETYASDFSAGTNGWGVDDGTSAGNIDGIGGQDDWLRFTVDGTSSGLHRLRLGGAFVAGAEYTVTMDVYVPSGQGNIDGIQINDSLNGNNSTKYYSITTGSIVSCTETFTAVGGALIVYAYDGATRVFTGNGTDVFYIRNVSVTQLTSNAYATTWYDQSGVEVVSDFGVSNTDVVNEAGTTVDTAYDSGDSGHASCVRIIADDGTADRAEIDLTTLGTGLYRITLDYKSIQGSSHSITSDATTDPATLFTATDLTSTSWATVERYFEVTSAGTNMRFYVANSGSANDEILLDNISIVEVDKLHNDATQTTADNQPKVITAGTLVSDANGNYALFGDGVDDNMLTQDLSSLTDAMVIMVQESSDTDGAIWHGAGGASAGGGYAGLVDDGSASAVIDADLGTPSYFADSTPQAYADRDAVHASLHTGSPVICSITGLDLSYHTTGYYLFGYYTAAFLPTSKRSAILVYPSDANRSAIEQSLSNTITTALS